MKSIIIFMLLVLTVAARSEKRSFSLSPEERSLADLWAGFTEGVKNLLIKAKNFIFSKATVVMDLMKSAVKNVAGSLDIRKFVEDLTDKVRTHATVDNCLKLGQDILDKINISFLKAIGNNNLELLCKIIVSGVTTVNGGTKSIATSVLDAIDKFK